MNQKKTLVLSLAILMAATGITVGMEMENTQNEPCITIQENGSVFASINTNNIISTLLTIEKYQNHDIELICKNFTDKELQMISENDTFIKFLTSLVLVHYQVTGNGLQTLNLFQHLKSLSLCYCSQFWYNSKLLSLAKCNTLQENLTKFKIFSTSDTSEIMQGIEKFKKLESLSFTHCFETTGEELLILAELKNLKTLSLCGCSHISDNVIAKIVGLEKLEWLDLGACTNLTEEGLLALLKSKTLQKSLKALEIWGCKITDEMIPELIKFKNLNSLNLDCCKNITDDGITLLRQSLPTTEISFVWGGRDKQVCHYH